jgi:16S rRNA (adenine1518-N6/adenine1519-N6)-dimethyltransferase
MNSLGVLVRNFFKVQSLGDISPKAFNPPPKVQSTVLSFKRISSPRVSLEEFKAFELFLRRLFKMRRKQIINVLKSVYPVERVEKALKALGIDAKIRAESLQMEEVLGLYNALGRNHGN